MKRQLENRNKITYHQCNPEEFIFKHEIFLPICLILILTAIIFSLVVSMPRPKTESANFDLKNIQIKKSNENLVQKQVQKDQKIKTKTISLQKTFDSQILKHHQILNTTAQPAQTPSRFYARLTNSQPLLNGRKA